MDDLDSRYVIRRMEASDYTGVVDTLKVLTTVGDVSESQFKDMISYWDSTMLFADKQLRVYNPTVIFDTVENEVAACGNIILERKIIHDTGMCGHIEDIAVSKNHQGKKLGKHLINYLTDLGFKAGCYKIILDCDEKNVIFYEKCGYKRAGVEMQCRL
ncbi:glucosamine 6-phosphate N-acetyltransferase [Nakaseomyces bracarensis]|uniref:glucosamine 6-phosphate N-acetyltransferase n=1 Tax=Nakaseomyces bracarensis TaxID=273131 RepID=UPI003871A3E4